MFGLSTPPMPCCPLLQRVNKALIKIPDYKVCHLSPFSASWMIAMIAHLQGLGGKFMSGAEHETYLLALHLCQRGFGLGQPEGHVQSLALNPYRFSTRRSSGKYVRVVPSAPCEQPISLHCGMGTDEEVAYQMLPATEGSPTLLTGELLHPTAHRAEKPWAALAGVCSPGSPSPSEGCWLGWDQAHAGIGQKTFQLL